MICAKRSCVSDNPKPSEHPDLCYECYLEWCYEMFGGLLEPTFVLHGLVFDENGLVDDCTKLPDSDDCVEIPF
jgi:hypothetical protein